MSKEIVRTERTKIKRIPKRGNFERETINQILDEGFVCHIGFTMDEQPFVLPTSYARLGENLIIHGSSASRMMRALGWEKPICVTVTLIDGLVLARSAFHHSMTEHIVPNRWQEVRPPNDIELKATTVLSLPIEEASTKIRTGNPVDDEEDYDLDVWAGVIPLKMTAEKPISDEKLKREISIPAHVADYKRAS
jgi:nitroimidazol reductase NimA-like FMN-containing flavoprotein (pyridoxamine 5'-phosphate oxidase superfamily)